MAENKGGGGGGGGEGAGEAGQAGGGTESVTSAAAAVVTSAAAAVASPSPPAPAAPEERESPGAVVLAVAAVAADKGPGEAEAAAPVLVSVGPAPGPVPLAPLGPSPAPPALSSAAPGPLSLLDTCAVCAQSLQSREAEPKLLPCLHSFCRRCLPEPERQLNVPVPGGANGDIQQVGVIRCPICRQECRQIDLVDNYFVKDTSEAPSSSDEKSEQVCTSCEDNSSAVGFCVECGEWLCKTCIEAHQRVKFTKDHMIRKKEDVSSEAVGASGQRPVFCPVHKQEQLKLFCETCDRLTCRDCQLLEHKEHRYQFLEEAFQNQKGAIENLLAKLLEKKNYVNFAATQVQNRIKEVNETNKRVEQEIKVAIFTLINEINKKGKALLQQLETVTKERQMKLIQQQNDISGLSRQVKHVMNFTNWAIASGSSTALLYSKRLITFQLRHILKARCDPVPAANGAIRFHCDPTFWAKNVVNLAATPLTLLEDTFEVPQASGQLVGHCEGMLLERGRYRNPPLHVQSSSCGPLDWGYTLGTEKGNLVIENKPTQGYTPNVVVGQVPPGTNHISKPPPQINLAQLRLQHMQQQVYAQQKHQQLQQMRMGQPAGQIPRQAGPQMLQQQPPRLISMQTMQRGMNCGAFQAHQMRMAQNTARLPGIPRHNGPQYMMQPHLQRQHSNPGHAGPFPVVSVHNNTINPTSPTTATMANANRGPTSPSVAAIELIPSVTNPENLPSLPDIPPIQLEDAGSSNLDNLLSRYIAGSHLPPQPISSMNPSPGPSALSPGSSGLSNSHTPVRPPSTSSTGSRGSCGSSGRTVEKNNISFKTEHVKVKQEPGTEEEVCSYSGPVKQEKTEDGRRSACMLSSPESSLTPPLSTNLHLESELEALGSIENHVKTEPADLSESCKQSGHSLVNGKSPVRSLMHRSARSGGEGNNKDEDPNEDWCAVCQNGGDLLCCEKCPKVFHLTCHVPTLLSFPSGDWICTFCRDLSKPEVEYDCDNLQHSKKGKTAQGLSPVDQRKCERLLLYLYCHELSIEFQEPVPASIPNYYKIIKKPMDLSTVKKKLQKKHSQHYQTPEDFVADVRLIFKNCERFNEMMKVVQVYAETQEINFKGDSEVAQAGKAVALYFEDKLTEIYPDRTFQPLPEFEQEEDDAEITDDSDEDFIQPRRKRLKSDERPVHIK
ncbi:E3 ubiquitin-protein ligase TRIM33 isoform X3 [Podarcis raffonei]|uniref:E3 ubiquitin-protein ligase TRIM33 isoform X3 n=1 Tax=Podarcis raffonei TaxID=65483 RepID=UPI0023297E7F|nr:E3 ubiquitin-protein ligase TRIM33 isoform X3 [Podarcis raffonei]